MTTIEALALSRLRQWAHDRTAENQSKVRNPNAHGWCRRDERQFDARRVRVMDTERILETLTPEQQAMLIYRYVYKSPDLITAQALGCSVRKLGYAIPEARHKLATAMDRLALI